MGRSQCGLIQSPTPSCLRTLGLCSFCTSHVILTPQISQPLCHLERKTPLLIEDTRQREDPTRERAQRPQQKDKWSQACTCLCRRGASLPPKTTAR